METTFWGAVVKPGKAQPFVPPPVDAKLHLSQATLAMDAESGTKVGVTCTIGEDGDEEVLLCTLREGATESQSLDLVFDHYTEFKVQGNAAVHLTGYYMPEYEEEDTDEDEDEDEEDDEDALMDLTPEEAAALAQYQRSSRFPSKIKFGNADEEDDDEDEDEEEEEDTDEDDDEDIEDMIPGEGNHVHIVELNDDGTEKADTDEDDEEDEGEEEMEEEEEALLEEGPRVIEVTGPEEDEDKKARTTKRKAADEAKQGTAAAKRNKVDKKTAASAEEEEEEGPAAREQKQEAPKAAAGKKAKKGKKGTGASMLSTWHPEPTKEEPANEMEEAAAEEKPTTPRGGAAVRSIPIKNGRPNIKKYDNGFIIEDTHMGDPDGKMAKLGQKVGVRYRGTLAKNGKVFDETKGSKTFQFRLGVGEVIKGWDRGVVGMRVGDKRRLTVPPQMAYGSSGVRGVIPPNATLNFDVELVDVKGK